MLSQQIADRYSEAIYTYVSQFESDASRKAAIVSQVLDRLSKLDDEGRLPVDERGQDGMVLEVSRIMVKRNPGLTSGKVACIKAELKPGHSREQIATKYAVPDSLLKDIENDKAFADVVWPAAKFIPDTVGGALCS